MCDNQTNSSKNSCCHETVLVAIDISISVLILMHFWEKNTCIFPEFITFELDILLRQLMAQNV